jgi:uracil-DNA glycosylase
MDSASPELIQCEEVVAYFGDLTERIHPSWYETFSSISCQRELKDIVKRLKKKEDAGDSIYPPKENIFRVFKLVPLRIEGDEEGESVKCVVIGQDPYPSGDATGVAFSGGRSGVIPASLRNIRNEVVRCYPKKVIPELENPSLEGWCQQGVLLLNQALTVASGKSGSHGGIWVGFITHIISAVLKENKRTPWLLWGAPARRLKDTIDKKGGSNVFEAGHPSPYSVKWFTGNNHFILCNDVLEEGGRELIDWGHWSPVEKE